MDSLVDELEGVRGDVEAAEAAVEAAEARARVLESEVAAAAAEVAALRAEIDVTRAAVVGSAVDASLKRLRRQMRVQARLGTTDCCCVAELTLSRLPQRTASRRTCFGRDWSTTTAITCWGCRSSHSTVHTERPVLCAVLHHTAHAPCSVFVVVPLLDTRCTVRCPPPREESVGR